MFDQSPDNPRALFWGGRYNGLADIFWVKEGIPAVGFAPGDETMKLFLEWHGLLEGIQNIKQETIFIPLLDEAYFVDIQNIATKLRSEWNNVITGLSVRKIGKAIQYAKKKEYSSVVIYGESEKSQGVYISENLETGKQEKIKICLWK
jgi:histidyl-tRNA synthetase